ncbi:MFS transporter [Salipiger mucosus]|uniref:MFS transporter n=1 Tax=Salipiger mucosus TaxID=263378 RepID=UPI00068677B9|nr:MFS transporter [Salipiger mucosus]
MEVGGGYDPQTVRLVGLPPLVLSLVAAPLSKRWGAPVTARIGLFTSATGLILAGAGGALTVAASALVSGGVGLAVPGLIATLGGAASDHNRGLALSVYTFSLFVGASVASPAATALAPAGPALLYGIPAVLLVAAAGGITLGLGRQRAARATQAT